MPFSQADTLKYRKDVDARGHLLSASDRETLLRKYLPTPPSKTSQTRPALADKRLGHKPRIRPYLRSLLHLTLYLAIQFFFGVYVRIRQLSNAVVQKFLGIRHYHHRTPAYIKKDTGSLSRLPEHLSILLRYDQRTEDPAALETLIDEVAELVAWSTAAGIPLLSIYEKTGILKTYMSAVQELCIQKLVQYFGAAPHTPTLKVYAPNLPTLSPLPAPFPSPNIGPLNGSSKSSTSTNGLASKDSQSTAHLNLLLLSSSDGRDTLVDLTRTLTEMSQSSKLRPKDITVSLINTEINATTTFPTSQPTANGSDVSRNTPSANLPHSNGSINGTSATSTSHDSRLAKTSNEAAPSEPDLLIVFAPYVKLDGYPPWQIRLTEIYCVGDSGGDVGGRYGESRTRVEYQAFLRGLWKYSGADMKFGR